MLAYILQGLLNDSQGDRLLGALESIGWCLERGFDRQTGKGRHRLDRVGDRPVETELLEERRPKLGDEAPHVAELAAEQIAQETELGPGESGVLLEDPLDVLDLEDRVRQRLGRSVVDLLGEPRALGLLGLDDPHLDIGRDGVVAGLGDEARVAALEE